MFALNFEQAYLHKFLQAKEATCIYLSNKVVDISLFGRLLPLVAIKRDNSLDRDCHFGLHLELASFDEVKSITCSIIDVIDDLTSKKALRIEDPTDILNQMVRHCSNKWDL